MAPQTALGCVPQAASGCMPPLPGYTWKKSHSYAKCTFLSFIFISFTSKWKAMIWDFRWNGTEISGLSLCSCMYLSGTDQESFFYSPWTLHQQESFSKLSSCISPFSTFLSISTYWIPFLTLRNRYKCWWADSFHLNCSSIEFVSSSSPKRAFKSNWFLLLAWLPRCYENYH